MSIGKKKEKKRKKRSHSWHCKASLCENASEMSCCALTLVSFTHWPVKMHDNAKEEEEEEEEKEKKLSILFIAKYLNELKAENK